MNYIPVEMMLNIMSVILLGAVIVIGLYATLMFVAGLLVTVITTIWKHTKERIINSIRG